VAVDAVGEEPKPTFLHFDGDGVTPSPSATRSIYLPETSERQDIPIYEDESVGPGTVLQGPCVIEADDTTVYVPRGSSVERDELWNLRMSIQL
jgi:N-methylhydantoinase A